MGFEYLRDEIEKRQEIARASRVHSPTDVEQSEYGRKMAERQEAQRQERLEKRKQLLSSAREISLALGKTPKIATDIVVSLQDAEYAGWILFSSTQSRVENETGGYKGINDGLGRTVLHDRHWVLTTEGQIIISDLQVALHEESGAGLFPEDRIQDRLVDIVIKNNLD